MVPPAQARKYPVGLWCGRMLITFVNRQDQQLARSCVLVVPLRPPSTPWVSTDLTYHWQAAGPKADGNNPAETLSELYELTYRSARPLAVGTYGLGRSHWRRAWTNAWASEPICPIVAPSVSDEPATVEP